MGDRGQRRGRSCGAVGHAVGGGIYQVAQLYRQSHHQDGGALVLTTLVQHVTFTLILGQQIAPGCSLLTPGSDLSRSRLDE